VAHAKPNPSLCIECCFCVQHTGPYKRNGARVFNLALVKWCDSSNVCVCILLWGIFALLVRLQIRYWDTAELVVIARTTIDWEEEGTLEEHVHNDRVAALAEQSLEPAPYRSLECPYMAVW
jgi:hypothetical protein